MFKTYSSWSSLVITSCWFVTNHLRVLASVTRVYWQHGAIMTTTQGVTRQVTHSMTTWGTTPFWGGSPPGGPFRGGAPSHGKVNVTKNSLCLQKALGAWKVCYVVLSSPAEGPTSPADGVEFSGADFSTGLISPGPTSPWGRLPPIPGGALVAKVSLLYKWCHFESELTS